MEFVSTNLRKAIETDSRLQNFKVRLELSKQIASGMNYLHSLNPYILVNNISFNIFIIFFQKASRFKSTKHFNF